MDETILKCIKETIDDDLTIYKNSFFLHENDFWTDDKLIMHHDAHVDYLNPVFTNKRRIVKGKNRLLMPSFASKELLDEYRDLDSTLTSGMSDVEYTNHLKELEAIKDEIWEDSVDRYNEEANKFMNDTSLGGWKCSSASGKFTPYVYVRVRPSNNPRITYARHYEYVMFEPVFSRPDEKGNRRLIRRKVISYGLVPMDGVNFLFPSSGDIIEENLESSENLIQIQTTETILNEANRQQLLQKSRNAQNYSIKNQAKGKNRFDRRTKSSISATVRDYNMIQMDPLFKRDILEFKIPVMGETDVYVVDVRVDGLLAEIRKQIMANKGLLEFKVILQSLMKVLNIGNVYIGCNCLHPETKIKLLDGTTPTVKEMCKRFEAGETLWVYSTDENGDFKPGQVERVWKTGEVTDFIKITLDNDKEIITTPEHPYMLETGTYVFACDLKKGHSLMSICFNAKTSKVVKVEQLVLESTPVYDIKVKEWKNFVVDAGVVLHNCPDAKYRMAYQQTKNEYKAGYKEQRPSDITNPNDSLGAGCKHVLLILSNLDWAVKVASVINNYIKYCKEHLESNYAEYIFPKVYGVKYDKAVQMNLFDTGLLPDDVETMKAVIDRGMQGKDKQGRFISGNNMRFQKKDLEEPKETPEENENQLSLNLNQNNEGEKEISPEEENRPN